MFHSPTSAPLTARYDGLQTLFQSKPPEEDRIRNFGPILSQRG